MPWVVLMMFVAFWFLTLLVKALAYFVVYGIPILAGLAILGWLFVKWMEGRPPSGYDDD